MTFRSCGPAARRALESVLALAVLFVPSAASADGPGLADFDFVWAKVAETHFDTTYGGVDWPAVRDELRPAAEAAASPDEIRNVIRTMLGRLGESHFELIPGDYTEARDAWLPSGEGGVGIEVRVLDGEAVVFRVEPDSPAARAGVRPGWTLTGVGDLEAQELLDRIPASLKESRRVMEQHLVLTRALSGDPGRSEELRFRDGEDRIVRLDLQWVLLPGEIAKLGFFPPFRTHLEWERRSTRSGAVVGVIRFNIWMIPAMRAFDEAVDSLRTADGIIIDVRGNPGGVGGMLIGTGGHFYTEPTSLGTLFGRDHRLQLTANPRRIDGTGATVEPYAGPVAILIDRHSYSASEFFAGGMQGTGRARVFGQPSEGWALAASFTKLPGGDLLEHAVSDFVTPTGARIEGIGVIPDEIVPLTREDLLRGADAPLEAAVSWIDKEKRDGN